MRLADTLWETIHEPQRWLTMDKTVHSQKLVAATNVVRKRTIAVGEL